MGLELSWKFYRKNILPDFRLVEPNSRSIEPDEMHNEFCNSSIPTLHKTHTLSKSKIGLKNCFDHGLPTIQIRVLIH